MNEPQITRRGILVILAIAACIGLIGHIDNAHRQIDQLRNTCQEAQ
jgi:hypothetical protein